MVFPLVPSPLGGNIGATTASFFMLDPTGTTALEPLIDLIPGITPLRVTFDMVDGEQITYNYAVTEHPIQSFLDITSNVHKQLERITINGTLQATPPLQPFPPPPVQGGFTRLDLLRIRNLKNIADQRRPIMVVTPRYGLAKAFIENITANWSPELAESSKVSITVKEARIVSPITGDLVPDFPEQAPGNNASEGGGQSSTSEVPTTATEPGGSPGVAPAVM